MAGRHPSCLRRATLRWVRSTQPSGVTRIYLTHPAWADFVGEGLDELLVASRNSPMVLARAVTNLTRLAEHVPPDRRSGVSSRLERAREYLCAGRLVPPSKPDDHLPHQEVSR
jgi:hypothetical protein